MTLFPFAIGSYLLGLTEVKFKHFIIGTSSVTMHVMIWLYLGTTLRHFKGFNDGSHVSNEARMGELIILAVELIFAIGVGGYISIKAKRELDRLINSNNEAQPINK